MVAHTTIHHNLEYPVELEYSKRIEHGRALGFLPKVTEVELTDRIDLLDEKIETLLTLIAQIDQKMEIFEVNYGTTSDKYVPTPSTAGYYII